MGDAAELHLGGYPLTPFFFLVLATLNPRPVFPTRVLPDKNPAGILNGFAYCRETPHEYKRVLW